MKSIPAGAKLFTMPWGLAIGEVAKRSGLPATTLRYYEEVGLLEAARENGRRRYSETVLSRLKAIGLCKAAGFTLDEIKTLLADDSPGRPASRALAEAKLADIDAQMATLAQARSILEWGMRCACPSIDACTCGIHPPSDPSDEQQRHLADEGSA